MRRRQRKYCHEEILFLSVGGLKKAAVFSKADSVSGVDCGCAASGDAGGDCNAVCTGIAYFAIMLFWYFMPLKIRRMVRFCRFIVGG